ncbi:RxLR-like protein [Plasmopara halstedii]|uniref:RxLR-like protein n=1 Tax=Plasmopara halstedii TaxID=4781 RepID=A0A0P1AVN9_PLAHL|nr:RxLR-like protein [Plasmopara halstedii]CEG45197.1 RxLR-like protein [Plasmopara halstedii]|eukprot:XP_024581566.1 RxLR-like protein [Plasmopara halstedii]
MSVRLLLALVFAINLHVSSMALSSVNDLDRMKAGNATQSTSTDYGNEERGMAGVEAVTEAGKTRILGFKAPKWWEKFLKQIMPTLRDRVSRFFTFIRKLVFGESKNAKAVKKNSSVKTVEIKSDPPPVVAPVLPKKPPASAPASIPASPPVIAPVPPKKPPAPASVPASPPVVAPVPPKQPPAPVSAPISLESSASNPPPVSLSNRDRYKNLITRLRDGILSSTPVSKEGDVAKSNLQGVVNVLPSLTKSAKKPLESVPKPAEKPLVHVPKSGPDETVSANGDSWSTLLKWDNKQPEKATTLVTKEGDAAESFSQRMTNFFHSWLFESVPKLGRDETVSTKSSLFNWDKKQPEKATTLVTKEGDAVESIENPASFVPRISNQMKSAEKPLPSTDNIIDSKTLRSESQRIPGANPPEMKPNDIEHN